MKTVFAPVMFLCVSLLSGCVFQGHLYPVQGPLSTATPPPVFPATVKGGVNPQSFSAVLANGETFKGPWTSVSSDKRRLTDPPASTPASQLKTAWDTVYGQGFYTAHILGTKFFAQTTLTGSKGTVLQVEIYRQVHDSDFDAHNAAPLDIKGVAQDDKGNVYKLVL